MRILREFVHDREAHPLQSEVRKSFRTVAERLNVDEGTVRNRIRKLLKTGFIEEWNVIENPALFGLGIATCRCDVRDETAKEETIQKLRLIQGVLMVTDYYGAALRLLLFHDDARALADQLSLVHRICNSTHMVSGAVGFPRCSITLKEADWQLIRSIRTDPWKQFVAISEETSLSTKTVKRRLARLVEGKALFLTLSIDPKVLKGMIPAELFVVYDSAEAKRRLNVQVTSRLEDCMMSAQVGDPEHALFMLLLSNVSEATGSLRWVRSLKGVKEAYLDLVQERLEQYEGLSRKLDSLLNGAAR